MLFARHIFTEVLECGIVELKTMQVLAGGNNTSFRFAYSSLGDDRPRKFIDVGDWSLRCRVDVNKPSRNEFTARLETGEILSD